MIDQRYLLGLLAGLIVAWFAIGIIYNLRRGEAVLRWMRGGLPKLGERSTLRWLGSSVAESVIDRARAPFRRVETLVVLAPRDAPWLWLWARLRGRRDTLIFRCVLGSPPRVALELADPASWTGRPALQQVARQGWESRPFAWSAGSPAAPVAASPANGTLVLAAPQGVMDRALEILPSYLAVLSRLSARPWRFAVRRDPPSLELNLPFPNLRLADAAEYFETLRELGRELMDVRDRGER